MQLKTPRLVRVCPEYPQTISKKARYERKQSFARQLPYGPIRFEREALSQWMSMWSAQIGKPWGRYTADRFHNEGWSYYGNQFVHHPVLICGHYAYAAAPMYDKSKHPWAAKFSWFKLINELVGIVKWLDLGGGSGRHWRALLQNPDKSYKWLYVESDIRKHPEKAEPWFSQVCRCGWRQLVEQESPCNRCSS